jgi:hypothetical protein
MGNKLDIELEGKYVILDKKYFKGETDVKRMFFCSGGFGCSLDAMGSAVFGHFTIDGEECRINRRYIKRLATPEEIAQAKYPTPLTEMQKLERETRQLKAKINECQERLKAIDKRAHEIETKWDD